MAVSTTEHRVAGDPPAEPGRVHAVADLADPAAPFMPEPQRKTARAVVRTVEHANIGAAYPDPGDIDDNLAGGRRWCRNLRHRARSRAGHHKRFHKCNLSVCDQLPDRLAPPGRVIACAANDT